MIAEVKDILQSFELLSDAEKRQLVSEILRRSLKLHWPPLSDEELTSIAEQRFLELDKSESQDA